MTEPEETSSKYTIRVFARFRGPLFAVVENSQEFEAGSMPEFEAGSMPELGEYHGPIDQTVIVPVSDDISVFVSPISKDDRALPGSPLIAWFDINSEDAAETLPKEAEIYLDELSDQLGFIWNYPVTIYDLSSLM